MYRYIHVYIDETKTQKPGYLPPSLNLCASLLFSLPLTYTYTCKQQPQHIHTHIHTRTHMYTPTHTQSHLSSPLHFSTGEALDEVDAGQGCASRGQQDGGIHHEVLHIQRAALQVSTAQQIKATDLNHSDGASIFQTNMTSIKWRKWFAETGQTITM